jgi:pimeloyl-ACP methyl ester carboxylesterase
MRSARVASSVLFSVTLTSLALAGCKGRKPAPDAGAPPASTPPAATVEVDDEPGTSSEVLARSFEGQEVWFVGGFMSELYDALSGQLEDEINRQLQESARSLNLSLQIPGGSTLDAPIGDAIADALPRIDLPIGEGVFTSFYSQMRDFDEKGIPYRNISLASPAFNTSESVEHNARAIRALLWSTDKKVILVTHSKGGLDTLHALVGAPALAKKVIGWVALQSPFYGSPLADSTFAPVNEVLLAALGGNGQSVEDLEVETRVAYMHEHRSEIKRLMRRIPVIAGYTVYESTTSVRGFARTLASGVFSAELIREISAALSLNYAQTPTDLPRIVSQSVNEAVDLIRARVEEAASAAVATIDVMTFPNAYLRDIEGVPNDGLVPARSTTLPGATHRELSVGDHASPVMSVDPFRDYWSVAERNEVTLALIEEVREMARARP